VAAETGTGLDVHVGETTGPEGSSLRQIIAIADEGFGYPITVSHVIGPGNEQAALRAEARARIGVVTLPRDSLFQPGRALDVPGSLDAGAPLAAGGDHVQDSVSPMGRADPLETAALLVLGARLTPAAAFASVSSAGRRVMRRPEVMIAAGAPADLVAVRAADLGGAIASGPPDRIVLRGGRVVARTRVSTEFSVH